MNFSLKHVPILLLFCMLSCTKDVYKIRSQFDDWEKYSELYVDTVSLYSAIMNLDTVVYNYALKDVRNKSTKCYCRIDNNRYHISLDTIPMKDRLIVINSLMKKDLLKSNKDGLYERGSFYESYIDGDLEQYDGEILQWSTIYYPNTVFDFYVKTTRIGVNLEEKKGYEVAFIMYFADNKKMIAYLPTAQKELYDCYVYARGGCF